MASLEATQAELDDIQQLLVENKTLREELRKEAKELKARYFELEAEREALLKERLSEETE